MHRVKYSKISNDPKNKESYSTGFNTVKALLLSFGLLSFAFNTVLLVILFRFAKDPATDNLYCKPPKLNTRMLC